MKKLSSYTLFWLISWTLIVAVSLWVRPLMPIDETRYAAVAWNMWLQHQFLVPQFLGQAYAQKPPLLFWLIHLSWALAGVNEFSARLIPALFGLGNIFLAYWLARQLWPTQPVIHRLAPTLLIANFLWLFSIPILNFDMLVCFFVLLLLNALLLAGNGKALGWWLFSLALGLGILSKGPVVLIYTLIPALSAPRWVSYQPVSWWAWYRRLLLALLLGILLALCWAIPAAIAGGKAYALQIFFQQSADRLVDSFAHQQPFYWYFSILPIILLPWLIWPNAWRACVAISERGNRGKRFLHLALWPAFLLFNLISQKAMRYLLPFLPIFSIFLAYGLSQLKETWTWQRWPVAVFLGLVGIFAILIPFLTHWLDVPPPWLSALSPGWGFLVVLLGIIWLISFSDNIAWQANLLAIVSITLNLVFLFGMARVAAPIAYDVRPIANQLHEFEVQNTPFAYIGKYFGEYQFYGRLTRIPDLIDSTNGLSWAENHPGGCILDHSNSYYDKPYTIEPDRQYYMRDHRVLLWSAKRYLENTQLNKNKSIQ